MRSATPVDAPARARIAILVALLVGAAAGSCGTQVPTSAPATPSPTASAPAPTETPLESAASSPASPAVPGPCDPTALSARVTGWTGAAGHRIASLELLNTGAVPCQLFALARPQLVDAGGAVLIDGEPPGASPVLELGPGDRLTTEVQDSNYCGPEAAQPVTLAFVFPEGLGRLVAAPDPADALGGLPPCLGAAGSAGTIEMQPWQP